MTFETAKFDPKTINMTPKTAKMIPQTVQMRSKTAKTTSKTSKTLKTAKATPKTAKMTPKAAKITQTWLRSNRLSKRSAPADPRCSKVYSFCPSTQNDRQDVPFMLTFDTKIFQNII